MEPSSSAESSSSTSYSGRHSPSKINPDHQHHEFDLDAPTRPPPPRWSRSSLNERLALKAPRLHQQITHAVAYLRGPRPKVDLPDPTPILDISIRTRAATLTLPLETALTRVSRPLTRRWLFILFAAAYIVALAFLSRAQSYLTPEESWIGCTSTFWLANEGCGLDGSECLPFSGQSYDFRCPAQCNSVVLRNPRTVGDEQVVYQPLIVGGGDGNGTYRGDSFICAAANQAGLSSNSKGGCFSLQIIGNFTDYLPKTANGLTSLGFRGVFPLSFQLSSTTSLTHCTDLRNIALAFNILITSILFFILRPKPLVLFWCLICIGFWHVSLFSQPRTNPPALDFAFGAFLPTLFVAYGFWRLAFRFTLPAFAKAPIEASILYIGPFWVGVLANITTNAPIDRLIASEIRRRPGGVASLVIIVTVLFILTVNQLRVIRKTGWLPWYIGWYMAGGLVIVVLSQLPGLQLRLHHYIIAMALIPGTAFPTRLSAMYQGFLVGLFLNGVAAFGYAPILQTPGDLARDGPQQSDLPVFLTNSSTYNSSIPFVNQTINWDVLPDEWDGYALLVDDVARYFGSAYNYSLAFLNASLPHYFRLAYTVDGSAGDFTMPAVLWPNGTWVDPLPGPS